MQLREALSLSCGSARHSNEGIEVPQYTLKTSLMRSCYELGNAGSYP